MSSESELAAFYGGRLDEDEAAAESAPHALDIGTWPGWIDAIDDGTLGNWERYRDRLTPARVLREVEAKRRMLADLLAERHYISDDAYYTCPAATLEHDFGINPRAARGEWSGSQLDCDCGRDERVKRRLEILVSPYAEPV